ncbi:eIF2A-related protein [Floridanema evergladense]|uniref:Novel STAND NTPase 1 domain-containing protein n=1 Tax=Floridaenema evergladense BLCC-F167 TaxID=3153639 RepID=A0ABV4WRR9_9CYAN
MTDLNQTNIMLLNEDSLKTLIRGITQFQGEFSLILAVCNYRPLRDRIVQHLKEQCPIEIHELVLEQSVQTLYTRIAEEFGREQPDALMIFGLETVRDLDQVLTATNQIREEFRKLAFPLVLWVTDEILQKLIRLVPDFHSWATTVEFGITTEELINFIQQTVDEVFAKILNSREVVFLDNAALDLEKDSPRCTELKSAQQELQNREVKLDAAQEAGLEFILGRVVNNSQAESRQHYERSLALWQQTDNQKHCGLLLFYLGLWWRNHAVRYRVEHQQACERAKDYFQQSIDVFEQANRPDLAAKFINFLLEVLHRLQSWDKLEAVAKKALTLHQTHSDPFGQARTYGFLAEVALSKSLWSEAEQTAQKALSLLTDAAAALSNPSPEQSILLDWELSFHRGWYLFSLAKAQQHLEQAENAISTLETARHTTKPNYDPELYILILKSLRESYFKKGEYLTAFYIKQERQAIESQFGLRAFIGAGRLQPKQQVTNPALPSIKTQQEVAQEISSSGRLHSVNRLLERIERDDCKLTIIHGESGVGKSSIEQAGLIPALKQKPINTRSVLTVLQQVYADWSNELGKSLAKELVKVQRGFSSTTLESKQIGNQILEFEPAYVTFNSTEAILSQLRKNADYNLLTILLFDQFEEFFFICKDPIVRKNFYNFLRVCLDIPYVKVIISLREDYLHYLLECTRFTELDVINNNILDKNILFYLGNFKPNEAKLIIQTLTEKTQFYLEPDLIDELIKDLAGGVNEVRPVELQIVGAQLQAENITTLSEYRDKGPKAALVGRFLEEVIKDCGAENKQLAELVLWLLTDENSTRPLRTQNELKNGLEDLVTDASHLDLVLEIFVKSNLVLLLPSSPENLYQLVHDYLAAFVRQQKNNELIEELEKEREQRKRSEAELNRVLKRQLKLAIAGGTLMTFLAVLAGVFGIQAKIGETNAELKEISAASESLFATGKDLEALIQGLKAGKKLKNWFGFGVESDTRNQVVSRLQEVVYAGSERNRLEGHTKTITEISFSPNGQLIATASEDKTVKLWSHSGKKITTLNGHSDSVTSLAFSPNSKILASGGKDKKIILWNSDGTQINTLEGHEDGVTDLCFSPDGQIIASASEDNTVRLWKNDGTLIKTFEKLKSQITGIRFSPDGQTIASASEDGTIQLWNPRGKKLIPIKNPDSVLSFAFSSDGKILMTVSKDKFLRFWSLDGNLLKGTKIVWNIIEFASLSSDGKFLIVKEAYELPKINKIEGFELKHIQKLPDLELLSVSFSPNGQLVALASKNNNNLITLISIDNRYFKPQEGDGEESTFVGLNPNNLPVSFYQNVLKIWNLDGSLNKLINFYSNIDFSDSPDSVKFRDDGLVIAMVGTVATTKILTRNGTITKIFDDNTLFRGFSPDGQLFVTTFKENIVKLWKSNGTLIGTLQGHNNRITEVKFSPDSQLIATVSRDNTVKLWNRDGKLIETLQGHNNRIIEVVFSPDSQLIATGSKDKKVKLWNRQGKLIQTIEDYNDKLAEIKFSPDRQMLFVSSNYNDLKVLGRDGGVLQTFRGHNGQVNNITFSPNSQIIATYSGDNTVKLWNRNGKEIKTLGENFFTHTNMYFSPDSKRIITVSWNGIKLWDNKGKLLKTLAESENASRVSFSRDSQNIAFFAEEKVSLWKKNGQFIKNIKNIVNEENENEEDEVPKVQVSKNGNLIASINKNKEVNLWNSNGDLIQTLKGHRSQITLITFSPDSQSLATVDKDNNIKLWRSDGSLILTLKEYGNRIEEVSFSADGKTISISKIEDVVQLFKNNGKLIASLKGHKDYINSVSFSPNGQLIATASNDKTVRLWKFDGTKLKVLEGHTNKVNRVRFSLDNQFIASASNDKTVKIWNQKGKLLKTLKGHKTAVQDVSFSPNSQLIASASNDSNVIVWNRSSGKLEKVLPAHSGNVMSVSFSLNGQMLASADDYGEVKFWSRNGTSLKSFTSDNLGAYNISFSPDRLKIFAYGSAKPSLWSLNLDELLERGCNRIRDYLKNSPNVDDSDRTLCDK